MGDLKAGNISPGCEMRASGHYHGPYIGLGGQFQGFVKVVRHFGGKGVDGGTIQLDYSHRTFGGVRNVLQKLLL